jgi:hypothetical protein
MSAAIQGSMVYPELAYPKKKLTQGHGFLVMTFLDEMRCPLLSMIWTQTGGDC